MLEWSAVMSPKTWAQATFGEVRLGDERRTRRAVSLAEAIAREPNVSLPKQLSEPKEVKATYRFLQSAQVSYEALLRPHVQQTREQCEQQPVVLLVQDTTELDYQPHRQTSGLGPIGNGRHQGFLLQTVLAVDPPTGELLGIAHQEPFVRKPAPKGERYSERVHRERESQVWERAVQAIGAPPEGVTWVHVGDRYSDIYTLFLACQQQQTHFVIRAAQDRCVDERVEEIAPALKRRKRKAGDPPQRHLFETVRGWAASDEQELEVPAKHQRQVESYDGLRRLLGLLAPLAVRLLQLRTLARQQPERAVTEVVPREVVQLVALKTGGTAAGMTVEQCLKRIAQLGGYQGRRSDGPPGWKTLWHGWLKIQTLLEGVHLAHQLLLE